jgi:hypothetical protein
MSSRRFHMNTLQVFDGRLEVQAVSICPSNREPLVGRAKWRAASESNQSQENKDVPLSSSLDKTVFRILALKLSWKKEP